MRRRVKVEEDDGGGLDSLLDTMTNVLGILVLVIVTTQLDVKDAVKRIADSDIVQPEALEAARQKLTLTKDQAEQIRSQLGAVPMSDAGAVTVEIDDLRRKIDETVGISHMEAQVRALRRQMRVREASLHDDNYASDADALGLRGLLNPRDPLANPPRVVLQTPFARN